MRSRPDLFSEERIAAIFGNLEAIYEFQKRFLVNLEHCLNWNSLQDSVIGQCFIKHVRHRRPSAAPPDWLSRQVVELEPDWFMPSQRPIRSQEPRVAPN